MQTQRAAASAMTLHPNTSIAYFSMEIGLEPAMPTYSGGLGVLAGDTLRAAADLGVPMVGVTLLHRAGHFRQHLDASGNQMEQAAAWAPETMLEALPVRVTVVLEGRPVQVAVWCYRVRGVSGHTVPAYLLDTAVPENDAWDQTLTDALYGGDARYRLCQEVVLGIGGVAVLRALGYSDVTTYHMNEGHAALLTLALLAEQTAGRGLHAATADDIAAVRRRCVFTTHTSVPAGHDMFPLPLAEQVLGEERLAAACALGACGGHALNMTALALNVARYTNAVSQRHADVSSDLFPQHPIAAITNGVHTPTWAAPPFQRLFDRHVPEWRSDPLYLRAVGAVPLAEVEAAHAEAKAALLAEVQRRSGRQLDPGALTIGQARRATGYKRTDLLFSDLDRLRRIAQHDGRLQVVAAGKAHPQDEGGKALIRNIMAAAAALGDTVPVVYLADYDMALGMLLCAGADLWLNTPQPGLEASGTSGMKAALNGVPSLSVLDGWWVEGHVEGVTGWSIGDGWDGGIDHAAELASLYGKLESVIVPLFYGRPTGYAEVRRSAIALNGSYFSAHRMLLQYLQHAYAVE